MLTQPIKYDQTYKISYRGCYFDSLLELKYALSIEKDYRYLREPFIISYDPMTLDSTALFCASTKLYTPDFLVRNKSTGQSLLVEIKPAMLKYAKVTDSYHAIAVDYIARNQLDCTFVMICERDIMLNEEQQRKYEWFVRNRHIFESVASCNSLDRKYNAASIRYFNSVPSYPGDELKGNDYAKFVTHGSKHHQIPYRHWQKRRATRCTMAG